MKPWKKVAALSPLIWTILSPGAFAAAPKAKPVDKRQVAQIEASQKRVADIMLDPESARFSGTYISSSGNVCGLVNGKNPMGGYAGKTRFIVSSDRVMLDTQNTTASFDYRWSEMCTDDLPSK